MGVIDLRYNYRIWSPTAHGPRGGYRITTSRLVSDAEIAKILRQYARIEDELSSTPDSPPTTRTTIWCVEDSDGVVIAWQVFTATGSDCFAQPLGVISA